MTEGDKPLMVTSKGRVIEYLCRSPEVDNLLDGFVLGLLRFRYYSSEPQKFPQLVREPSLAHSHANFGGTQPNEHQPSITITSPD